MRLRKLFKTVGPLMAVAAAGGLAGCNNMEIGFDSDGVPLAELDLSGEAPDEVVLAGPDTVLISQGEELAISVEGSDAATERLRFSIEDGSLGISREQNSWGDRDIAVVNVTMPAPRRLVIAGSGRLTSDTLAADAEVSIAGSGTIETRQVDTETLEVSIAGSGNYLAAGMAETLELSIAGSGEADMADLKVGSAEINIAGSGDAVFASDGEVEANIMGSGDVRVRGSARCTINSVGSGSLTCDREAEEV